MALITSPSLSVTAAASIIPLVSHLLTGCTPAGRPLLVAHRSPCSKHGLSSGGMALITSRPQVILNHTVIGKNCLIGDHRATAVPVQWSFYCEAAVPFTVSFYAFSGVSAVLVFALPLAAKALPLRCVSTALAAKALPLCCVPTAPRG